MKGIVDSWHEKVIAMTVDFRSQAAHAVQETKDALAKAEQSTRAVRHAETGHQKPDMRYLHERLDEISQRLNASTHPDTRARQKPEPWNEEAPFEERRDAGPIRPWPRQQLNPAVYAVGRGGRKFGEYVNTVFWQALMDAMPNAVEREKFEEWYGTVDDRERDEPHFFLIHNKKVVRTTFRQIWVFAQAKYVWKNMEWLTEFREEETPDGKILWADRSTRENTWREHNFRLNEEDEKKRVLRMKTLSEQFEKMKLKRESEIMNNKPGDTGRGRAWARPGEREMSRGGQGRRFGWKRQFGQWTRGDDRAQKGRDDGHAAPARRDARQPHWKSREPQDAASERRQKSGVAWAQPARGNADGAEQDHQAKPTAATRSANTTRRRGRSPGSSPDTSSAEEDEKKGDLLQD
jgi:hypothetical protein